MSKSQFLPTMLGFMPISNPKFPTLISNPKFSTLIFSNRKFPAFRISINPQFIINRNRNGNRNRSTNALNTNSNGESSSNGNGNGNGDADGNGGREKERAGLKIKWRELVLDPDPENVVAVGLTGLLTWASVQVLWQIVVVSIAILVAALKYSIVAALLIFILVTLL